MIENYTEWFIGAVILVIVGIFVSPWVWFKCVQWVSGVIEWLKVRSVVVRFGRSWKWSRTLFVGYHAYPWIPHKDGQQVKLRAVGFLFWTLSVVSVRPNPSLK